MSVSSKDLHEIEVKVRLTEKQARLLEALSDYHGIPRAVIARKFINDGIRLTSFGTKDTAHNIMA